MDTANDGRYEATPVHCFACAVRDAENRSVAKARQSQEYGDGSFDGLYVGVRMIEQRSTSGG